MADEEVTLQPSGDHAVLAQRFPDEVLGVDQTADGHMITKVRPDGLFQVATGVKSLGYRLLSVLDGYHTPKDGQGVFYAFVKPANAPAEFGELRLRVELAFGEPGEPGPQVQSLCDVYPAANWHEREMYDMYGIRFEGHPDLRRMFLPAGWTGHPGRHDYKEPEQYVALREGEDIVVKEQEEGSW